MAKKQIIFRLEEEVYQQLQIYAIKNKTSVQKMVEECVLKILKQEKPGASGQDAVNKKLHTVDLQKQEKSSKEPQDRQEQKEELTDDVDTMTPEEYCNSYGVSEEAYWDYYAPTRKDYEKLKKFYEQE